MPNRVLIDRRTMLHGAGAAIALPLLEAMLPCRITADPQKPNGPPGRMAVFYFGTGMNIPDFLPADIGKDFTLSPILEPLAKFKDEMTVLSGTYLEHGGGHSGDYTFLTGVGRRNDGTIVNSTSADQVAAARVGKHTRFASVQLSVSAGTGYGGCMSTLAWNKDGIPLPAENDPHVVFSRLFRTDSPKERAGRERDFRRRGSVLDAIGEQAKQLEPHLSGADRQKLDEYFTSVRGVEQEFQRNIDWAQKPKPFPNTTGFDDYGRPFAPSSPQWEYERYAKMMYDLIALAFQTDSTRVLTYVVRKEAQGGIYPGFNVSNDYHALTHLTNDPAGLAAQRDVDKIYMRHWAHFLGRLKSIKEPDGVSLLDRTLLAFSSGMGFNHSRDRLPTALFGGKALGVAHQGHLKLPDNTPLAALWHTMLDRLGVSTGPRFQDSRGPIKELLA
jgi:hypothetical protein